MSWSGQDDPGGSGIASYDVYVSDNGGPFVPFLTDTTQTSASFAGVNGHTYGFWSVATDNVGNSQATPTSAQATTKVAVSTSTGPPHVGPIATPILAVRSATSVKVSAPFTEPGASGPHTAIWSWGDGTTSAGKVTESKRVGLGHRQSCLRRSRFLPGHADRDRRAQTLGQRGGRTERWWFTTRPPDRSPARARSPRQPAPSRAIRKLTGKATFQLSASYASNGTVPSGSLMLTFTAAHLSFKSTSLDWLVVSGGTVWCQGTGHGQRRRVVQVPGGGRQRRLWNGQAPHPDLEQSHGSHPIRHPPRGADHGHSRRRRSAAKWCCKSSIRVRGIDRRGCDIGRFFAAKLPPSHLFGGVRRGLGSLRNGTSPGPSTRLLLGEQHPS